MNKNSTTSPQGYPLSMLFVLLTGCATLAAMLGFTIRVLRADGVDVWEMGPAAGGATIVSVIIGMCLGMLQRPIKRGLLVGGLTGALIGLCSGPLVLLPSEAFPMLMATATGGATLLVLVAALARLSAN